MGCNASVPVREAVRRRDEWGYELAFHGTHPTRIAPRTTGRAPTANGWTCFVWARSKPIPGYECYLNANDPGKP